MTVERSGTVIPRAGVAAGLGLILIKWRTPQFGRSIKPDGGVAYGVGGLILQVSLSLKCRLRHLHRPGRLPEWCRSIRLWLCR
jgi:hypothetical protein